MKSIYTMSPEAMSPAQTNITYYNAALTTTGHNMSGSRPTFTEAIRKIFKLLALMPGMISRQWMYMDKNVRT